MRGATSSVLLVLGAVLLLRASPQQNLEAPRSEAEVRGVVLETGTNQPVPDAEISISFALPGKDANRSVWKPDESKRARTDQRGAFTIRLEVLGSYRVEAKKAGYGPADDTHAPDFVEFSVTAEKPNAETRLFLARPETRAHAILEEARALPVEVFADMTFSLLEKLSANDKALFLEEIFQRAGQAREPLPLRHAALAGDSAASVHWNSVWDLAKTLDRAHDRQLDALSLRCRAVRELLSINPKRARELAEQIPVPEIPRTACEDEFVPDAGILIETLAEVVERGEFTKEEREKQVPWFIIERAARLAGSSWQVAAAAKVLPRLAHNEAEAETLSAALAADLGISDTDRAFTAAVRSGSLVGNVIDASRALHAAGAPEILSPLRGYLLRHLRGLRCKDDFPAASAAGSEAGMETDQLWERRVSADLLAFNQAAGGRSDVAPLSGEEATPMGLSGEAERSKYGNDEEFRGLWNQLVALGPPATKDFSAARLTNDWAYRARQTLSAIEDWKGAVGPDSVRVFHQKSALLQHLIDMAPAGDISRSAVDQVVVLLGDPAVLDQSPVEWVDEVKFYIEYFGVFTRAMVETARSQVDGFFLKTGLEFWQGLADSRLPALSLYGRIGLLKTEGTSPLRPN